jgi:hypothetical protein
MYERVHSDDGGSEVEFAVSLRPGMVLEKHQYKYQISEKNNAPKGSKHFTVYVTVDNE